MTSKLYKKIFYRSEIELISGLHIGNSKETAEIGGVDSPIVRRKDNNQPYIPGSSLKGKIRSLLEITHGKVDTFKEGSHIIGKLFGAIGKEDQTPSRLIVRDSYMSPFWVKKLDESENTDLQYTEVKFENSIDRLTGTAKNGAIRQIERVPAGAKFEVEFVMNIVASSDAEADKNEADFRQLLKAGFKLLEDDYLGGSGSRGYGQLKFSDWKIDTITTEQYLNAK
jgi:CRISPR-associated protein Csm3